MVGLEGGKRRRQYDYNIISQKVFKSSKKKGDEVRRILFKKSWKKISDFSNGVLIVWFTQSCVWFELTQGTVLCLSIILPVGQLREKTFTVTSDKNHAVLLSHLVL